MRGIELDTCWFTGNYVPIASVEAACIPDSMFEEADTDASKKWQWELLRTGAQQSGLGEIGECATPEEIARAEDMLGFRDGEYDTPWEWEELVPASRLGPGYNDRPERRSFFNVSEQLQKRYTHVRLNMFPDGGIARMRVHGQVQVLLTKLKP